MEKYYNTVVLVKLKGTGRWRNDREHTLPVRVEYHPDLVLLLTRIRHAAERELGIDPAAATVIVLAAQQMDEND